MSEQKRRGRPKKNLTQTIYEIVPQTIDEIVPQTIDEIVPIPKRRGRPCKAPEDKKIHDSKAYNKEYYEAHKDNDEFRKRKNNNHTEKQKRTRELYTLVKNLLKTDQIIVPEEAKKDLQRLTVLDDHRP